MIDTTAPSAPKPHDNESSAPYRAYETAKHAWRTQHLKATAQEYGAAMRELADVLGV